MHSEEQEYFVSFANLFLGGISLLRSIKLGMGMEFFTLPADTLICEIYQDETWVEQP